MFANIQKIELDTIYQISVPSPFNNLGIYKPFISANSGLVNIYHYISENSSDIPANVGEMMLTSDSVDVSLASLGAIPTYIYVEQASGITTKLLLVGLNAD